MILFSFQGTDYYMKDYSLKTEYTTKHVRVTYSNGSVSKSDRSYLAPSHFSIFLRKEVIQPHLPIRLPCYDFTPIIGPTFGSWLLKGYLTDFGCYRLSWCDGRCVQGPGTYSPRHAYPRLLAIPASCRRVAAYNPN